MQMYPLRSNSGGDFFTPPGSNWHNSCCLYSRILFPLEDNIVSRSAAARKRYQLKFCTYRINPIPIAFSVVFYIVRYK